MDEPTAAMTATGRSARSSGLFLRTEVSHEGLAELGTLSRLLVLEIDEDVCAALGALPHHTRPPLDVGRRVAFVAQPEIGVRRRHLHWRRQLLTVGDAECQIARA